MRVPTVYVPRRPSWHGILRLIISPTVSNILSPGRDCGHLLPTAKIIANLSPEYTGPIERRPHCGWACLHSCNVKLLGFQKMTPEVLRVTLLTLLQKEPLHKSKGRVHFLAARDARSVVQHTTWSSN
jgi:hypothetical protein